MGQQMQDDELTPVPPSSDALTQAVKHCGDAMFSQTSAIRELRRSVDRQTALIHHLTTGTATLSERISQVVKNEEEEREILRGVERELAKQGVIADTTARKVDDISAEHPLIPRPELEPGERIYVAVGRWLVQIATHRATIAITWISLAVAHVARSFFHG